MALIYRRNLAAGQLEKFTVGRGHLRGGLVHIKDKLAISLIGTLRCAKAVLDLTFANRESAAKG
jgi:hypothetical protein